MKLSIKDTFSEWRTKINEFMEETSNVTTLDDNSNVSIKNPYIQDITLYESDTLTTLKVDNEYTNKDTYYLTINTKEKEYDKELDYITYTITSVTTLKPYFFLDILYNNAVVHHCPVVSIDNSSLSSNNILQPQSNIKKDSILYLYKKIITEKNDLFLSSGSVLLKNSYITAGGYFNDVYYKNDEFLTQNIEIKDNRSILEVHPSILKTDKPLWVAKGSIINGITYTKDTEINTELQLDKDSVIKANNSLLAKNSIIKNGGVVNNITYSSNTTINDDITIIKPTNIETITYGKLAAGSIVKPGCIINKEYYFPITTLGFDIKLEQLSYSTLPSYFAPDSIIKAGSLLTENSYIAGFLMTTKEIKEIHFPHDETITEDIKIIATDNVPKSKVYPKSKILYGSKIGIGSDVAYRKENQEQEVEVVVDKEMTILSDIELWKDSVITTGSIINFNSQIYVDDQEITDGQKIKLGQSKIVQKGSIISAGSQLSTGSHLYYKIVEDVIVAHYRVYEKYDSDVTIKYPSSMCTEYGYLAKNSKVAPLSILNSTIYESKTTLNESIKIDSNSTIKQKSILSKNSVIYKDSVVNGTKYEEITTLDTDITLYSDARLTKYSVINAGSVLEAESEINHLNTIHYYYPTILSDVLNVLYSATIKIGSIISTGSVIAVNSIVNGKTYYSNETLKKDITVSSDSTLAINSSLKANSYLVAGSIIDDYTYTTPVTIQFDEMVCDRYSHLKVGSVLLYPSKITQHSIINGVEVTETYETTEKIYITKDSGLYKESIIAKGSFIAENSVVNGDKYISTPIVLLDETTPINNNSVLTKDSVIATGSKIEQTTINGKEYISEYLTSDITVKNSVQFNPQHTTIAKGSIIENGSRINGYDIIKDTTQINENTIINQESIINVIWNVIAKGSKIKHGSTINGVYYNEDVELATDEKLLLPSTFDISQNTILQEGSLIKTGSIIDDQTYTENTTLTEDIILKDTAQLKANVTKLANGSVISKGSVINDQTYTEDTTIIETDVKKLSYISNNSILKKDSYIEIDSIINNEFLITDKQLSEDITIQNKSIIKPNSLLDAKNGDVLCKLILDEDCIFNSSVLLEKDSILRAGSLIKKDSFLNYKLYKEDISLENDLTIHEETTLGATKIYNNTVYQFNKIDEGYKLTALYQKNTDIEKTNSITLNGQIQFKNDTSTYINGAVLDTGVIHGVVEDYFVCETSPQKILNNGEMVDELEKTILTNKYMYDFPEGTRFKVKFIHSCSSVCENKLSSISLRFIDESGIEYNKYLLGNNSSILSIAENTIYDVVLHDGYYEISENNSVYQNSLTSLSENNNASYPILFSSNINNTDDYIGRTISFPELFTFNPYTKEFKLNGYIKCDEIYTNTTSIINNRIENLEKEVQGTFASGVTLNTAQTITGQKTFSKKIIGVVDTAEKIGTLLPNGTIDYNQIGDEDNPVYVKVEYEGTLKTGSKITATTKTIGSSSNEQAQPIYMKEGKLTAIESNIGGVLQPIYMTGGKLASITVSVGTNIKPLYLDNGKFTPFTSTIGTNVQPIYLNNGEFIASVANVGDTDKHIYLKNGNITASTSTIGNLIKPVYITNGKLTQTIVDFSEYLRRDGTGTNGNDGRITGNITFAPNAQIILSGVGNDIVMNNKTSDITIVNGEYPNGSFFDLKGSQYGDSNSAGVFTIQASNELNTSSPKRVSLIGTPDAHLTWNGYNVITSEGGSEHGTINGNFICNGEIRANKVYSAVWNDYAEFFPKGEETEPGDIIALDETNYEKEQYIKATNTSKFIVGVHSNSYGHILGGEDDTLENNLKKYIPIGLSGRIDVYVTGDVSLGDAIVPSNIPGVGCVYNKNINNYQHIVGFVVFVYDKDSKEKRKVKIKIQ